MYSEIVTVRVDAKLDFRNASDFKAECLEQVQPYTKALVLDFSATKCLGSPGLGSIFSLHRQLSPQGIELVLAGISTHILPVIKLTRLFRVVRCFTSLSSAEAYLSRDAARQAA